MAFPADQQDYFSSNEFNDTFNEYLQELNSLESGVSNNTLAASTAPPQESKVVEFPANVYDASYVAWSKWLNGKGPHPLPLADAATQKAYDEMMALANEKIVEDLDRQLGNLDGLASPDEQQAMQQQHGPPAPPAPAYVPETHVEPAWPGMTQQPPQDLNAANMAGHHRAMVMLGAPGHASNNVASARQPSTSPAPAPAPTQPMPATQRPANRVGQMAGWPQALRKHKSVCGELERCEVGRCQLMKDFPVEWAAWSNQMVNVWEKGVKNGRRIQVSKLWEYKHKTSAQRKPKWTMEHKAASQ